MRAALLVACLVLAAASAARANDARNMTALAHIAGANRYASCASYVHPDGREYAAIGTDLGTQIFNVTNPSAPSMVGFIPGPLSIWREMKQYRQWLYIVSEGTGAGAGLQIVRMGDPDAPVLAATYIATFKTAHTVSVDTTRALLYASGTASGMHQLSLASPESPVDLGAYTAYYVHDVHLRGTRAYLSCIGSGLEIILDVTTPGTFPELARFTTPGHYPHNAWTDASGRYLYCTDETLTGTLSAWDIGDLAHITMVANYLGLPGAIVHNVHVKGDTAFVAYYTAGVRCFDLTDPTTPVEFAYYDTYPDMLTGFNGCWGVDPFLPSGTILASDITYGLFVLKTSPVYGTLRGTVQNAMTAAPIPGAQVVLSGTPYAMTAYPTGRFGFSPPDLAYSVRGSAFGYAGASIQDHVWSGQQHDRVLALDPLPSATLTGTIVNAVGGAPLTGAAVSIATTPLVDTTGADGLFTLTPVPLGPQTVQVDRPGFVPWSLSTTVSGDSDDTFALTPAAWYDDAEIDRGWSLGAAGDNATSGLWIRADPVGTYTPLTGYVQPEDDDTPGAGTTCFVTGNGTPGGDAGEADVDGGHTTLVSPLIDMSAIANPVLAYWLWFSTSVPGGDTLVVDLSNDGGVTWARAETIVQPRAAWTRHSVTVAAVRTPTASMRMRVIASDTDPQSTTEAALDDIEVYPASQVTAVGGGREPDDVSVAPSPWRDRLTIRLRSPATVRVIDVRGRTVASLVARSAGAITWDGRTREGRRAPPGVYLVRAGDVTRTVVRLP